MGGRRGSPSWRVCASTTAVVACFIEYSWGHGSSPLEEGLTTGVSTSSAKRFRHLEAE